MKLRTLAIGLFGTTILWAGSVSAETLTLPFNQRPEWVSRDGIVMAGSWEALPFRVRRQAGQEAPTPEQQAGWDREHSPEMVEKLKALGVNFVMSHCYKGAGVATEEDSLVDAVTFARICHEADLRVGVYTYSGAFLWQPFFKEVPEAKDWILLDEEGKPFLYGPSRYYWNRNHPEAVAFYRQLVQFAVEEIRTDLIHFDNYHYSAGFDAQSVKDFRKYLRDTFSAEELKKAGIEADSVLPPKKKDSPNLLKFAWQDFECGYLAKSYLDMSRYARSLRKNILMECNPGSVPRHMRPPVDHSRMLPGGEAAWDEGGNSGFKEGKLATRIRTYKVYRLMNNMTFSYIMSALEAAEAMAFNHPDCLGCICWFEFGNIVNRPGNTEPPAEEMQPFIRFFHNRRDLLRGGEVVADVAVLRSFPSQVFADPKYREMTAAVEDKLIAGRVPFQIIHNQQLPELKRWPVLVLAGCVAMSDDQIDAVTKYAHDGGKLAIVDEAATHDQWMRPRDKAVFTDLPAGAVVRVDTTDKAPAAINKLLGDSCSLIVDTPAPVCAELTSQPGRLLVHLVNYDPQKPVEKIIVTVGVPRRSKPTRILVADPQQEKDVEIPFETKGNRVHFVLPKLSVYAVAAVQMEQTGALR